ncbi:MAG: hypothetical protein FD125_835 [bacterium]|jgi:hypothetical protein|nr:MAG: hypothetical protein FD125_835 [bacterium]
MITTRKGAALAASAAMLAVSSLAGSAFAGEPPAGSRGLAVAATDRVHCYGVNTCNGTADCATTAHECKGQNSCRGQGFKAMTAQACLTAGGVIGDLVPAQ